MNTEERLANLELQLGRVQRQNRLLLGAIFVLLVSPFALEVTAFRSRAQARGIAKEIRANKIVLEDERTDLRRTS